MYIMQKHLTAADRGVIAYLLLQENYTPAMNVNEVFRVNFLKKMIFL